MSFNFKFDDFDGPEATTAPTSSSNGSVPPGGAGPVTPPAAMAAGEPRRRPTRSARRRARRPRCLTAHPCLSCMPRWPAPSSRWLSRPSEPDRSFPLSRGSWPARSASSSSASSTRVTSPSGLARCTPSPGGSPRRSRPRSCSSSSRWSTPRGGSPSGRPVSERPPRAPSSSGRAGRGERRRAGPLPRARRRNRRCDPGGEDSRLWLRLPRAGRRGSAVGDRQPRRRRGSAVGDRQPHRVHRRQEEGQCRLPHRRVGVPAEDRPERRTGHRRDLPRQPVDPARHRQGGDHLVGHRRVRAEG